MVSQQVEPLWVTYRAVDQVKWQVGSPTHQRCLAAGRINLRVRPDGDAVADLHIPGLGEALIHVKDIDPFIERLRGVQDLYKRLGLSSGTGSENSSSEV